MASKTTKRGYFQRKSILLALLLVPAVTILLVFGKLFLSSRLYDYKVYKLNHITKEDLTNTYTNEAVGYTFNYPKNANVYKWFGTQENSLRVFSEGNNQGNVCDIYVNDPQRNGSSKSTDTVFYNDLA